MFTEIIYEFYLFLLQNIISTASEILFVYFRIGRRIISAIFLIIGGVALLLNSLNYMRKVSKRNLKSPIYMTFFFSLVLRYTDFECMVQAIIIYYCQIFNKHIF
jgi:hypothetical protein